MQVARALATHEVRRRQDALTVLEEKARDLGFSLAELTAVAPARKRASVAPRYANPFKPDETWSGRGRKPRWFDEALAAGKTVDDLQI